MTVVARQISPDKGTNLSQSSLLPQNTWPSSNASSLLSPRIWIDSAKEGGGRISLPADFEFRAEAPSLVGDDSFTAAVGSQQQRVWTLSRAPSTGAAAFALWKLSRKEVTFRWGWWPN